MAASTASRPRPVIQAAGFVDRLMRGARAADLLVEQPAHYERVLNLRAAAALGLTVPHSMTMGADRVVR